MPSLGRRSHYNTNIWPGFVDALATLLMVVMFLLVVFILAQLFLSQAISGRDDALQLLRGEISELAELLALERKENNDLRLNVASLSQELQNQATSNDELSATLVAMEKEVAQAKERAKGLDDALEASGEKLAKEKEVSQAALEELALLNRQMAALREQLKEISAALEISERVAKEQKVQVVALGKRLNAALAGKVQELSRYRSEFFGRLREILGNQPGVLIFGDRFIFQSEVLFKSGSATLGEDGQKQLSQLAGALQNIAAKIPDNLDWILRVDGHTDKVPIQSSKYPSNWELSAARAISVVKFLASKGIPPRRLAAAGFGEFRPLDTGNDDIALRRNRRIELKFTQR
jgi:chemotaxis protein MotB